MQETRRLIGKAVSLPPAVFYEALGQPQLASLRSAAYNYFDAKDTESIITTSNDRAKRYFVSGLAEAAQFVVTLAAIHPHLGEAAFTRIASDNRTILSLAYLASQNQNQAVALMHNPGLVNQLSDNHTHVTLTDYAHIRVESPNGPCPAVRYNPETDTVAPEPIFVRFGTWAGKIGVRAYFAHAR